MEEATALERFEDRPRVVPMTVGFMGRGPDPVERLTEELGVVKARAERAGERLLDEFRELDRIIEGLREEGITIGVKLSEVPIQSAYARYQESPARRHAKAVEVLPEAPTWLE